jgi:hypothetical protein
VDGMDSKADSTPKAEGVKIEAASSGLASPGVQGSDRQEPTGENRGGMEAVTEHTVSLSDAFILYELTEIDKDLKESYLLRYPKGTDLDLLLRIQQVRQLNRIAKLLTQLNDAGKGSDDARKGDNPREPIKAVC